MNLKYQLLSALMSALLFGCKPDGKSKLPNTPEAVVLAWQRYVDLNLLDSARLLSTQQTQDGYLAYLDSLSVDDLLENDLNQLKGLTIAVKEDTAQCDFYFEYELGEKVPGRLFLLREKGQWKVDRIVELDLPLPDTLTIEDEQRMFPDTLLQN